MGVLISYHFWRGHDLGAALGQFEQRPFTYVDSGAFSAQAALGAKNRKVAPVTVDGFADWLDLWPGLFDACCTLDILGDFDATLANTEYLWDRGHQAMPVFHVGEPWAWLDYWCQHYQYVGLGGMVPWRGQRVDVLRWLIQCFTVAREHGTRFHGLGQTNPLTLGSLPFYSVDSSSWTAASRFMNFRLFDPVACTQVTISRKKLTADAARMLRFYGIDATEFVSPHFGTGAGGRHGGARTGRVGIVGLDRTVATAKRERAAVWSAMMRSAMAVEEWMRRRHGEITLPGLAPGPHVCLVTGARDQIDTYRDAVARYEESHHA